MARLEQGSISVLTLAIATVGVAIASSAPAAGATRATQAKHGCLRRAKQARRTQAVRPRHRRRSLRCATRRRHRLGDLAANHGTHTAGGRKSQTTAPSAPANLSATPGDSQVTLSWAASTGGLGVAGYRVYRNGGQIAQTSGTAFTDTALANGTP